jgi:hypothetical protein
MVNRRKGQAGVVAVVVRILALVVIAASAGCTDEACFIWSEEEGACPSREQALKFFAPAGCSSSVESVDSDGEYVVEDEDPWLGDLCCYTVTQRDNNDFDGPCGQPPF